MKSMKFSLLAIVLLLASVASFAQTFTIPGISGISFDESGTDYTANITDDFTAFGVTIAPQSLNLDYTAATNSFSITGTVENQFDGNTINSTMNFTIVNQNLTGLSFDISGDFDLDGLTFSPTSLTFQYDTTTSLFEMFGDASISFDGNTIALNLGDDATPGIEIDNGSLEKVNSTLTADFTINSLDFSPDNLSFQYNSTSSLYEMFGDATISFDSNTIDITLGDNSDPGIEIVSGSLQQLNASISTDFTINGLDFSPNGLTFKYESSSSLYEIFGSASIAFDSNTIDIVLGDDSDPGIEISSGSLQQLNASISTDFTINGLDFSPDGLTFKYESSSTLYEIFGSASIAFDSNTIDIVLGDDSDPGIEISSGSLQQLSASITADFTINDLDFSSNGLTFQYDASASHYELFGDASVSFDSNTLDVGLGNDSEPGIVIDGGTLESLNLSVSADFDLAGLTITPEDLTFIYNETSQKYVMFGLATISMDGNDIKLILGTESNPGLVFEQGSVNYINATINADFNMKSLTFKSNGLGFIYDSQSAGGLYSIFGETDVTFDSETVSITLGDASSPGFEYHSNEVQKIDIGVTADFTMKGIEFNPQGFNFEYDRVGDQFEMFGTIKSKIEGNSIDLSLGDSDDPGLVIRNGIVEDIQMGVTADFNFRDMTFSPDDLTFVYNRSESQYEM